MSLLRFCLVNLILLTGLCSLVSPSQSSAATPLTLLNNQDTYALAFHLEILEDEEKKWTIEQIASNAFSDTFKANSQRTPFFKNSSSAFWIRFQIKNKSASNRWILHWSASSNLPDFIDFYSPDNSGSFIENKQQEANPNIGKEHSRLDEPTFFLTLNSGETKTYYLRVQDEALSFLTLQLRSEKSLAKVYFRN